MKILVFVEHDIIIRHFLHSHVFGELERRHDVAFVFPEQGNKRVRSDLAGLDLGKAPLLHLPVSAERLGIWQKLMLADILRWRPGRHFAAMRRFQRHAAGAKAAALFSVLALPGLFQAFRAWSLGRVRAIPNRALDALLDEQRPDVIIHPSVLAGVFINDLVVASGARGIPLVVIMNSWDNPSTKRAIVGRPDWLLVWGPQTRSHAVEYVGMPAERVVCFGAAQFDLYRNPPRIDRDEFCRLHEIAPAARILLYAGSSKGTDEFSHLCVLDEAIGRGELGATVVVYRPHPWGDGGKGGERILDHSWRNVRIERTMRGYLERVKTGSLGITTPDYRDTHDILSSVDALLSPLSTIIVEGALHGKPVLCFLPDEDDSRSHFSFALPLTHFDDFFSEPCFLVARGNDALVASARMLLEKIGDREYSRALLKACSHFVSPFNEPYGERLVRFVEDAVGAKGRIAFLFKRGREVRTQGSFPTEFLYGMVQLQRAGYDVQIITDGDLGLDSPPSRVWRALSQLVYVLTGIPWWPLHRLMQRQVRERLDEFDCVVATTNVFGVCLGVLRRLGVIRPRVLFIAMGLIEPTTAGRVIRVYRWLFRKGVALRALSEVDAEHLASHIGIPVSHIPFGVDAQFWKPDEERSRMIGGDYVLSIGNDSNRDYQTLLDAWKPEYPLLRIVTGQALATSAANVEIQPGDWHKQILTDQQVRTLMQQARFVILPIGNTVQPSGQSVCLQAMACAKAVVITDFPGLWNRELLRDGDTCVLAGAPGSCSGIQDAVERLLADSELADAIGSRARKIVESNLNVDAMAQAMAGELDGMLDGTPR